MAGAENAGQRGKRSDGRIWAHEVQLTWDGLIDMQGDRITRLLIEARGSEKLQWGNVSFKGRSGVTCLPAGHPIDLACKVHYGIVGVPIQTQ